MKHFILLIVIAFGTLQVQAQPQAIQVDVSGEGSPVIFLPGFVSPGSVFDETAAGIEGTYEKYFISYAGFNGLAPIDTPWYSQIRESVVQYIVKQDLEEVVLIGHSMGGMLAADVAAELPDRMHKVVFVDALPCMREVMMPGVSAEQISYSNPYNDRMLQMDSATFSQTARQMAMGMTEDTEKAQEVISWMLEADRKTYVYGYTDLLKLDLRERLSQIDVSALVIGAPSFGAQVVRENMEKQYANLSDKQIKIAPGGRHFVMFDELEWLTDQINGFLAE
ncbi:alpha/beta fold hydrolase [Roseivirga sp. BDSF3-8]|uniref:alpha/beta fold hydrolase n=1 Tax=Roseivirga sp. BDSF3-8 TaxID=3241598 RepID=UPI003531A3FF